MKKLTIIFVSVLAITVSGQTYKALFDRANQFYKEAEFNEAIEDYRQILSMGYESAPVYFNLGNAYYRTGRLGEAILNYERALRLDPSNDEIQHNLKIANSETVDEVESLPPLFIFEWWEYAVSLHSVNGWTVFAFICYALFIALITWFFITRDPSRKRLAFFIAVPVLVITILSSALLYARIDRDINKKYAVVTAIETTAKSSPDLNSQDAFVIHEGLKVKVEDKLEEWYKIRLNDGKVGWIENESAEII